MDLKTYREVVLCMSLSCFGLYKQPTNVHRKVFSRSYKLCFVRNFLGKFLAEVHGSYNFFARNSLYEPKLTDHPKIDKLQ